MTSFSRFGIPIRLQSPPPLAESQPAKSTFWCVKNSSMLLRSTPRSDDKCELVRPTPTTVRPFPNVCPRSAKIGPAEVDVRTGTPASKRNVEPPLVEPVGALATLPLIAVVMNEIKLPFCDTADGTKCAPCERMVAGLFGSADPPRKSGSSPEPKMKSCEIFSRRPWACAVLEKATTAARTTKTRRMMLQGNWCEGGTSLRRIYKLRTPRRAASPTRRSRFTKERQRLPAVVRERLVGVGHAVRVFLLLDGVAFTLRRRDDLCRELLGHRLLVAVAGI